MASVLLSFKKGNEKEVDDLSKSLQGFLEQVISREHWNNDNPIHFGPIWYVGVLKHPQDGSLTLFLQVWRNHAETLFCAIDAFFERCDFGVEYDRDDKV